MASSSSPETIHVGTRRSALAMVQANAVVGALRAAHPHVSFEIHAMATMGDKDKTTPLPELGKVSELGKGLWTSELEAQLVSRELDMVIHCVKDMPTTLPASLVLSAVTAHEDRRDVVVFRDYSNSSSGQQQDTGAGAGAGAGAGSSDERQKTPQTKYTSLSQLPAGSVIGTSSVRRAAQLRRAYPTLQFRDVRGNIDTRLKKLDAADSPYDCIILAAAGLLRMDLGARIAQYLDSSTAGGGMLYAVGQGALGIETRAGDARVEALLGTITDRPTMLACFAERSVMRTLEGGCSVPIGVETTWVGENGEEVVEGEKKTLRFKATVVSLDGKDAVDGDQTAEVTTLEEAEAFGRRMAEDLVGKGAQNILDFINKDRPGATGAVKLGDAK